MDLEKDSVLHTIFHNNWLIKFSIELTLSKETVLEIRTLVFSKFTFFKTVSLNKTATQLQKVEVYHEVQEQMQNGPKQFFDREAQS